MLWSTVGGSRLLWRPRVVVGDSRRTGGEPCGDTERYSVCLVFLNGADLVLLCYCHIVM